MITNLLSPKKILGGALLVFSIIGYGWFVFAAAPSGGYTPGQTLNPDCAPDVADPDCVVQTGWQLNTDDGYVYNLADDIGIGTDTPAVGFQVLKDTFRVGTTGFNPNQVAGFYGAGEDGGTGLFSFDLSGFVPPLGDNGEAIYLAKTTGTSTNQRAVLLMYDDGSRGAETNLFVRDGSDQPGFAVHPDSADFYYYKYNINGSGTDADIGGIYVQDDNIFGFQSFDQTDNNDWNEHNFIINETDGFRWRFNVPQVNGTDGTAQSQLQITSDLAFSNPTDTGSIVSFTNSDGTCTLDPGDVSGLSCPSDENLKKDIALLGPTLNRILELRPVTYRMKKEAESVIETAGLIAQEVEAIFPKLVKHQEDGTLGLNYGGLMPYVIKAIQELAVKIENRLVTKELCVEDVCVDRATFLRMVQQAGGNPLPQSEPLQAEPDPEPQSEDGPESDMEPSEIISLSLRSLIVSILS
jgi:hypothetical protein